MQQATVKGAGQRARWFGMGAGLAMKSGNADGVKAPTASHTCRSKHPLSSEVEKGWTENPTREGVGNGQLQDWMKSRMLGKPLVRFREGRGGNQRSTPPTRPG